MFRYRLYVTQLDRKSDGWSRHETFKHSNYNIPSGNLLILSDDHINEVKNTLVYLI